MKKIKLLRIATETYSLHILLRGQLDFMQQNGFEVFMASSPDDKVPALIEQQNAEFFPLPLSRKFTLFQDFWALYQTIVLILKIKPQIVHTHSPKAGIVGMLAAFLCRVPLKVHTVAGLPLMETTGAKRKLLNAVESLTYYCADWVLPNSNHLKNFIIDNKLSGNSERLRVLGNGSSNGINVNYFSVSEHLRQEGQLFKESFGIATNSIILSFVGRLANYKGINELVEAFEVLQASHNNLYLLLIGAHEELNPLKDSTKSSIQNNKSIIAVGHQQDVRKYLTISDIFVFPSYREGFPQALMQACAMEVPSIATHINGCNEIIIDKVTGILIEPKSIAKIVGACDFLIKNKALRHEMGQKARQHVIRHFEQQSLWKTIMDFYKEKMYN
ncbi:D-inositol-3-phosphate glycosyltransferase [Dyadobacter sp. CECT 9275]|uniref:D-inositol-3-phosphate glycosyltransferase n=1 Tax=Dyadobacter helix TaxID=2822344 RepID=A0A916NMH0_9BACT|nr:glycosyltransferase family 4 protein [Dyadobacter sp. CECT 9275]CAG5006524.1 D-inositol-3-phosphate glycosyltransferase [Dyadobacter sp. CECT 9275]